MKTARIKTEIFFPCLGSQFSMASDLSGLIVFLIIGALIVGFIAYAFLSNRLANDKRKDLIRAFRASPKIIKDGPILVKGPAEAPDLLLPTTGEHVTFYCLFIVSRESAIAETRDRTYVKIGGFGQRGSHITSAKGFRIFETSGDFIVSAGDTPYLVSVKSIIAYFAKGAAMFTGESTFRRGPGGLLFAQIENDLATATICLQGAQLTHWQPRSQAEPVTFMSATVQYTEGKSLRAGVPICWPWFGPHPADKARASHGFARNVLWEARAPARLGNGATQLALLLSDSEKTLALWPHRFVLEYRVTVGDAPMTIKEVDGTLSVPLKLDGQVEVSIEPTAAARP